jgi:hypothetical protein
VTADKFAIRTGPSPGQLPTKSVAKRPPDALVAKAADVLNNPIVSLQEMHGVEYIVDSELVRDGNDVCDIGQWRM